MIRKRISKWVNWQQKCYSINSIQHINYISSNNWERHEPYTNVLWLHYIIDKMINGARYRNSKTKKHRATIQEMMQLRDSILDYKNCSEVIKLLY